MTITLADNHKASKNPNGNLDNIDIVSSEKPSRPQNKTKQKRNSAQRRNLGEVLETNSNFDSFPPVVLHNQNTLQQQQTILSGVEEKIEIQTKSMDNILPYDAFRSEISYESKPVEQKMIGSLKSKEASGKYKYRDFEETGDLASRKLFEPTVDKQGNGHSQGIHEVDINQVSDDISPFPL